jgi:hypothetical protein
MEDQKLGLQGASTLADVLKVNTTLLQLHCENNGITLGGFTDLVNALHRNTTLLYLPSMQESRQMALKQTEDQVKSMRDDHTTQTQTRSLSIRNKITNKVGGKAPRERSRSTFLSDQDIKAALGLVDESWARQEYRLQQYLHRNHNIANGIPTTMEVDDEQFERPDTATNINNMVERAMVDSTPTMEKELDLGTTISDGQDELSRVTSLEKGIEMAFQQNRTTWGRPRLPS